VPGRVKAPVPVDCAMDHSGRQARLREALQNSKLDFLLVTHPPNLRYLCGFTGSTGILLLGQRSSVFFTDGRYTEQARLEVESARAVISRKPPLAEACARLDAGRRGTSLGIESDHMTVSARSRLRQLLPRGVRLRESAGLVEQGRRVKEAAEIARLRAAVLVGDQLFSRALEVIRPGVTESEVAAELEYAARRAGAEAMSFPTIVAAGTRSALPHGQASSARIPRSGFVVLDFGVILAGYCSDMTRTVYVGRPTRRERSWYEAVREAQGAATRAVRAGRVSGEVDQAARKVLQREGLGHYFTHSTGHGVGLEIHEAPRLASRETEVLRAGMVVTIEPGVYLPGKGGVRIEDMVVVTEGGCEVLTPTGKELITV